ncbi:uncharacterized protein LOC143200366 [Rhynchophorus ferrugineus]|uniref:Uncharacterized protein n=1 Tax=Rhynchophorus ferrugineus TaxID=354439 RepID=A0A834M4M3_RHYFE|nr:hypothetical protein GWI33_016788 [Rhynchophorus ferrugineus]
MSRKLIIPSGLIDNPNQENTILIPRRISRSRGNLITRRQGSELVAHQLPEFDDELSSPSPRHGYSSGDDSFQRDFQPLDGSQLPCSSLRSSPCSTPYSGSLSPPSNRHSQPKNLSNASRGSPHSAGSSYNQSGYCTADTSGFDVPRRLVPNLFEQSLLMRMPDEDEITDDSYFFDDSSFDMSLQDISQDREQQGLRQLRSTFNQSDSPPCSPANVSRPGVLNRTYNVPRPGALNRTFDVSRPGALNQTYNVPRSGALNQTFDVPTTGALNQTYNVPRSGALNKTFDVPNAGALNQTYNVPRSGALNQTFDVPGADIQNQTFDVCQSGPLNTTRTISKPAGDGSPCANQTYAVSPSKSPGSPQGSFESRGQRSRSPERSLQARNLFPRSPSTSGACPVSCEGSRSGGDGSEHLSFVNVDEESYSERFQPLLSSTHDSEAFMSTFEDSEDDPDHIFVDESFRRSQEHRFNIIQNATPPSNLDVTRRISSPCAPASATFAMPRSRTPSPSRSPRTSPRMDGTYHLPSKPSSRGSPRGSPTGGDACSPACSAPNTTYALPHDRTRTISRSSPRQDASYRIAAGSTPVGRGAPAAFSNDTCSPICSAPDATYDLPRDRTRNISRGSPRRHDATYQVAGAPNATFNLPPNQTRIIPRSPASRSRSPAATHGDDACSPTCSAGNTTYDLPQNRTRTLSRGGPRADTTYQISGSPQALNRTRNITSSEVPSPLNRTCPGGRNQTMNLTRPTVNMNQTRNLGRASPSNTSGSRMNSTYSRQCSDGCSEHLVSYESQVQDESYIE